MLQSILKKILLNSLSAKLLRNLMLKLHNLSYKLSAIFSTILNDGRHPKHEILKYEKWFADNVEKSDIVLDIGSNTGLMVDYLSKKVEGSSKIQILAGQNNSLIILNLLLSPADNHEAGKSKNFSKDNFFIASL